MSAVSAGAISGARLAYDIHNSNSNQENQGLPKVGDSKIRRPSTSNQRSPLSNLSAGRAESGENGPAPQQRSYDRTEAMDTARANKKKGLEVDGPRKLYKSNGSTSNLSNAESDDIPENMYRPEKDDIEGWIHREKLAKIENEELQAAGINLAKSRSRSREALGGRTRTASRDRLRNDYNTSDGSVREDKKRNFSSPTPRHVEEDQDTPEKPQWDLRTPEEIAAEQENSQTYTTPVLRKTGSRIPVLSPTASASASPPDRMDGDTSIPRKRAMSDTASNDEVLSVSKLRTGGANFNGDAEGSIASTSRKASSPTKLKQKSVSAGPATHSQVPRKTYTTKPTPTSPNGRPRTRGHDAERPRTATNPPEGDPPWLADMYKPDPRLPPDQQIIPTIAKKRQQVEWEQNGMVPKTYDREFTALAVHGNHEAPIAASNENGSVVEKIEDSESWPLKTIPNNRNPKEMVPKSMVNQNPPVTGGYSTMPKVSSPPMSITSPKLGSTANANPNTGAPSPNIGPSRQNNASQAATTDPSRQSHGNQQQRQRIQQMPVSDEMDEKAQKKGCGCCIVM